MLFYLSPPPPPNPFPSLIHLQSPLTVSELGLLLSILHRLQSILVPNLTQLVTNLLLYLLPPSFPIPRPLPHPQSPLTVSELGLLLSILHRLQSILVLNSSHFDNVSLRQLQEDLRDVTTAHLTVNQRLALVERIVRSYHFLQPQRKSWPMTGPFV